MSDSEEQLPDVGEVEDKLVSIIPKRMRDLRACLFCGLIKTRRQFEDDGCDNCEFLNMQGDPEAVEQSTSSNFEGMAASLNPQWKPGCYAIAVHGRLTQDTIASLADMGIEYHPLDEGL